MLNRDQYLRGRVVQDCAQKGGEQSTIHQGPRESSHVGPKPFFSPPAQTDLEASVHWGLFAGHHAPAVRAALTRDIPHSSPASFPCLLPLLSAQLTAPLVPAATVSQKPSDASPHCSPLCTCPHCSTSDCRRAKSRVRNQQEKQ